MKITLADKIFSTFVRMRAGWCCQRCGTEYKPPTKALHTAHYYSRGKWSVRFHEGNAISACYGCHRLIDTGMTKVEKLELYLSILGSDMVTPEEANKTIKDLGHTKKSIQKWARGYYREKLEELDMCKDIV